MNEIVLDHGLDWRDIARIANGSALKLSAAAAERIRIASQVVAAIVASGERAYGVNTGIGALSDTVVDRASQNQLSHNIIFSHACGVGPVLGRVEARAIMAAQIANFAHGHSGVRPEIVEGLLAMLKSDCIPDIPSRGSAGYLTHCAHIALVLIGHGKARIGERLLDGPEALTAIGRAPIPLLAKEGLSLVNGTACATGLACIGLARAAHMLDWADAIAALSLEAAGCQMGAFDEAVLAMRVSDGIARVGLNLRRRLAGSELIRQARGKRTQDALSLRAIPHVHGAARDVLDFATRVVNRELASVTDNPAVSGSPDFPVVSSEAHAVAAALGQAMDSLAVAVAQIAAMSERRLDRLINPLVSGLAPFLAINPGAGSGFMIAQYTAAALAAENRRLASPASLDGGVTSALQEDFLAHPTAAATKLLDLLANAEQIFAIELATAAQAHDHLAAGAMQAPGTALIYRLVRSRLPTYADDRSLGNDLIAARHLLTEREPPGTDEVD